MGLEPGAFGGEGLVLFLGPFDHLETEQGDSRLAASRTHLAGLLAAEHDRCAAWRQRPFDGHRHQALAHQSAVSGARRQFLADIASLVPVDAVKLIEAAFEKEGFLDPQVLAAVGQAVTEARLVVILGRRRREPCRLKRIGGAVFGQDGPCPDAGESGIDETDAAGERPALALLAAEAFGIMGAVAEKHRHRVPVRRILDRDLGPQLEEIETALQIPETRALAVDHQGSLDLGDEEIVQELALGVEKGGVDRPFGADLVDVVRDQALEKLARIGAADGEHAAFFQEGERFLTEGKHRDRL